MTCGASVIKRCISHLWLWKCVPDSSPLMH